jgi:hypothetical protein
MKIPLTVWRIEDGHQGISQIRLLNRRHIRPIGSLRVGLRLRRIRMCRRQGRGFHLCRGELQIKSSSVISQKVLDIKVEHFCRYNVLICTDRHTCSIARRSSNPPNQHEGYEIQKSNLSDEYLFQRIKLHHISAPWIHNGHIAPLLGHFQQGFTRIDVSTVWETHWWVIRIHSLP